MKSALRKAAKVSVAEVDTCDSPHGRALWAAQQLSQLSILAVSLRWTSQTQAALRGLAPALRTCASGTQRDHSATTAIGVAPNGRGSQGVPQLPALLEEYEAFVAAVAAVLGSQRGTAMDAEAGALQRQVLEALLLTVLHLRDVLRRLLASGAAAVDDFAWQSQLRCGWFTDSVLAVAGPAWDGCRCFSSVV